MFFKESIRMKTYKLKFKFIIYIENFKDAEKT